MNIFLVYNYQDYFFLNVKNTFVFAQFIAE